MRPSMLSILKNQSLKAHSTWGIGGPAKCFTIVKTIDEMKQALALKMRYIVIGKGSNCLFDDQGFDGLVILNKINFLENKDGEYHVGSGFNFSHLGVKTARDGYAGLEFASGIPGTVGGAIYMNAGAGSDETCDHLKEVEFMHNDGSIELFQIGDLEFSYRSSPFQKMEGAIVGARFSLKACQGAKNKQRALIDYRKSTQPYGQKSCGCVFRNPEGGSAGALIEKCGLKGLRVGGLEVSMCHANFLVNHGEGTASDAIELIEKIQAIVKEKEGIDLQFEVKRIGV